MPFEPGTELTASLRLVAPLGEGAMGSIWIADDLGRGQRVAVKVISSRLAKQQAEALARFRREAEAASRLASPHVVKTFAYGRTEDGTPYIVMELLRGETLGQRLAREQRLAPDETARMVHQVALALGAAHGLGIVHRDIKPDNVFLVAGPRGPYVKVFDFGTVKDTRTRHDSVVTATGVMVGTLEYMSPEQVLGSRQVDHRTDLWSLGVLVYQTLTGRDPFGGPHPQALCLAICLGQYAPVTSARPELPAEIDGWFARALARDADRRFASAAEMASTLAEILCPEGLGELPVEPAPADCDGASLDDAPTRQEEAPGDAYDDLDEPTEIEPSAALAGESADAEPTERSPASRRPADGSDEEATRAFHRDVLRVASGAAQPAPAVETPAPPARPPPKRPGAALLLVASAAAVGALAYAFGWPIRERDESHDSAMGRGDARPLGAAVASARAPAPAGTSLGVAPGGQPDPGPSSGAGPASGTGAGGAVLDLDDEGMAGFSGDEAAPADGWELDLDEEPAPVSAPPGASAAEAGPGYLTLVCVPRCDQVVALGRARGPTPVVRAPLPPGEHELTLKRAGRPDQLVTVRMETAKLTERRVVAPAPPSP